MCVNLVVLAGGDGVVRVDRRQEVRRHQLAALQHEKKKEITKKGIKAQANP